MLPSNPKVKLVIHVRASLFCNIETTFQLCGALVTFKFHLQCEGIDSVHKSNIIYWIVLYDMMLDYLFNRNASNTLFSTQFL